MLDGDQLRRATRVSFVLSVIGVLVTACVSPDSPLVQESQEGCNELNTTGANLEQMDVDPAVKTVMVAAVDFRAAADVMKRDVLNACASIAVDLGAANTWDGINDVDQAISNGNGTGACDQASVKVEAALNRCAELNVQLGISVSRGECHIDWDRQVQCDTKCTEQQNCVPGTVETRCEPGKLSVKCDGACAAQAECVGTVELAANCQGKCEAECEGECNGPWIGVDGKRGERGPCKGKCKGECKGKCKGRCKIQAEAGVECGANVRCSGGCTSSYTEPVCETKCNPPQCTVDKVCHDACTATVTANRVCTPTQVHVFLSATAENMPEFEPVRVTLEKNFAILVDAAEKHGEVVVEAGRRLSSAGESLKQRSDSLTGKSLACLGESVPVVTKSVSTLEVCVSASARITTLLEQKAE